MSKEKNSKKPEKKKILVTDDHPFMRTALFELLDKSGKFSVMTAEDGYDAIAKAETYDFDVILMDISMPEKDGIETTRDLIKKFPSLKILILTGNYNKEDVFQLMAAGAMGYILKDAGSKELEFALEKVLKGEYYFGNKPMQSIIQDFKEIVLPRKVPSLKEIEELTPREVQIIKYLSQGLVNKQIAVQLQVSKRTIDKHRTNILKKLKVNNTAELIAHAAKYGLVE
ncbi:MAG TPA: response regulator transcription factor [Chitinophagales bacterium]|nr:response regulator transcription factor [Chitinophagales bacterium]